MNDNAMLVPTVLFWILAPCAMIFPARWAIVVYLLLVQIDLSALGNFSTTSLGAENAIKVVLIPSILLLKVRHDVDWAGLGRRYLSYWAMFAGYVGLAVLWSPYRVPGLKMIGYLYAYAVLFLVFMAAWRHRWLSARVLMFVIWCSVIAGTIQTYFLGNAFGSNEFEWRFTSFTGAQSLAPFLLSLSVLLLFCYRLSISIALTVIAASTGLLLTGSRSAFLGFIWVLLMYGIFSAARSARKISLGAILKRAVLIGAAVVIILVVVVTWLPENRLNEMVSAAVEKNATVEDVGTFGWRLSLYQKTLDELVHRSPVKLLVGSGTSSGASLVLDEGFFVENNLDPNRALHDEFLRSAYEWGLLGLFALIFFLIRILRIGISMVARGGAVEAWAFLAIFAPFLLSLTVENVMADSGSPGGVGYTLVFASMMAAYDLERQAEAGLAGDRESERPSDLPNSAQILPEA